jgi:nicotinate dehydrogenase subunit B
MLHARVIRPRGQAAYGAGARVLRVDDSALASIPGARLLRRNDFLGVVAPLEWDAIRAAQAVIVEWESPPTLPTSAGLHAQMRAATTTDNVVLERGDVSRGGRRSRGHRGAAGQCAVPGARTVCAQLRARRHSAGKADWSSAPRRMSTPHAVASPRWWACQRRRSACSSARARAPTATVATTMWRWRPRCCRSSRAAPVRVQFMRADEHGWDTYGPPHVGEARLACDAKRPTRRLRVSRLAAQLEPGRNHLAAGRRGARHRMATGRRAGRERAGLRAACTASRA